MMAGHLNGSGRQPVDNAKIASLDEARRRAAAKAHDEKRAARSARVGAMSGRDWVVALVVVAMAIGMIWFWMAPLINATGATR